VTLPGAQQQVATRSTPVMNAVVRPGGASVALIDEPAPRGVVPARTPGPQGRPSATMPALTGVKHPRPSPSEAAPASDANASASVSVLATEATTDEKLATTSPLARDAKPTLVPTLAPQTAPAREAEEAGPTRPAATWSDLAVVAETVPIGERTRVAVRDDPVGHWMVGVDDAIRAGWRYPAAVQARGVEGNVIVTFRVKRSGKVVDAQIVSGSGDPYLDMAALVAVPERVPPLPKKAPRSIEIRYIFRYRAP
jgi:TonB family protein